MYSLLVFKSRRHFLKEFKLWKARIYVMYSILYLELIRHKKFWCVDSKHNVNDHEDDDGQKHSKVTDQLTSKSWEDGWHFEVFQDNSYPESAKEKKNAEEEHVANILWRETAIALWVTAKQVASCSIKGFPFQWSIIVSFPLGDICTDFSQVITRGNCEVYAEWISNYVQ